MTTATETDIDEALRAVTTRFQAKFTEFCVKHATTIAELNTMASWDPDSEKLIDHYWDAIDQLESVLGAEVANCYANPGAQDEAITAAERWVSANVEHNAALILWHLGADDGKRVILELVGPDSAWYTHRRAWCAHRREQFRS